MRQLLIFSTVILMISCNGTSELKSDQSASSPTDLTIAQKNKLMDSISSSLLPIEPTNIASDSNNINLQFTAEETDLMNNLAWQWRNIPKDDFSADTIKFGNIILFSSTYSFTVITSLKTYLEGSKDGAFKMILHGQRHNPKVQDDYMRFRGGNEKRFWELASLAYWWPDRALTANLKEACDNIAWQIANNPESINNAKANINSNPLLALFFLMWGQRHNPHVMELYRICFREKRAELFKLVTNTPNPCK